FAGVLHGSSHAPSRDRSANAWSRRARLGSMRATRQPTRRATQRSMADPSDPGTSHTVTVPNSIDMVALLGPGDEHLDAIERAFDADVHVRGNRITLRGEPAEVALAERLLDEMVTIIRTGQG